MRAIAWAAAAVVGLVMTPAWGQTNVKALQAKLYGQHLALRNYSADAVVRYSWSGGTLSAAPVVMHGLEVFIDESVKLTKGKIIFQGKRETLVRDGYKSELAAMGKWPMRLEVDLQGADPVTVLPQLAVLIFFPDFRSAIGGLPLQVADMLPATITYPLNSRSNCECTLVFADGNWVKLARKDKKYAYPELVSSVEPEFTDEARQARIYAEVVLLFYVSKEGKVGEVWVARPVGYGLDENAAKAVSQYLFSPAIYDQKPVGTMQTIQVTFQMF